MISVFHGKDEKTHQKFQAWRKANVDGFHMTENAAGQFTIHYTQDKRENFPGRGCMHQGGSDNDYLEDKDGCYTTARKVCSNNLTELFAWATENGFTTKNCKNCDTRRFPFPTSPYARDNLIDNDQVQESNDQIRRTNEVASGLSHKTRCWVQYHNYDKLGYLPGGLETPTVDLSTLDTSNFKVSRVTTGKRMIRDAIGDVVFFIVGYGGRPKKYVLWSWCRVKDVQEREDGLYDAFGEGKVLSPLPALAGPEFDEFWNQNVNFSLGFRDISRLPYVKRLIEMARAHAQLDISPTEDVDEPSEDVSTAARDAVVKHFVSYHNADKMGYTYEEATRFSVGTTKSVDRLQGQRVWSISGEGRPRKYYLRDTWIVDAIGPSEQEEFVNYAHGSSGFVFDPPVHLNRLPWFPPFLKSQSNFSLGLQPIKADVATELEAIWASQRFVSVGPSLYPDEVDPGAAYREGAVVRVSVNVYERNPAARRACLEHHGTNCCTCGFDFGKVYGPEVDGLIHVHHLRPLSELATEYTIDPVADLRPVCPNCHAVLHARTPSYTIEEVQRFLARRGSG